jgi:hypothetical protein
MFRKTSLLLFALGLVISLSTTAPLLAQGGGTPPPAPPAPKDGEEKPKTTGDSPGPERFWQASVNGGTFMVALDRIASISRHKYVLDGSALVDEVTVDTVGQALARFYFISPITDKSPSTAVKDIATHTQELVEKSALLTGTDIQNMVVKKYPDTTHAKALEYRILNEPDLTALYTSVKTAWESAKGRKFATAAPKDPKQP